MKKIVKTHENELELLNFNEWNEKMQNEITFYIGKSNKSLFGKKQTHVIELVGPCHEITRCFLYLGPRGQRVSHRETLKKGLVID